MSIPVELQKQKNFTCPLHRFLTYLLGPSNNPIAVEVHPTDALCIFHQDKDEEFCHVEFPDADNGLKLPRVWWINPWRADYNRMQKMKQESAARRLEANKRTENAVRLAKQLVKMTGIDYDVAYKHAITLAVKKDTVAADVLKTKLDI